LERLSDETNFDVVSEIIYRFGAYSSAEDLSRYEVGDALFKIIDRWKNTKVYPQILGILAKVRYPAAWDYLVEFAKQHPFNEDGLGIYFLELFGRPEAIPLIESFRDKAEGKYPGITEMHLQTIEDAIKTLQQKE
jgi:hypothetical protein